MRVLIFAVVASLGCGGTSEAPAAAPEPVTQRANTSGDERAAIPEATVAPAPPPPAPPPPAPPATPRVNFPRYTEIQAYLQQSPRGQRCFQNNIISASLTETFVDGDFDGDGAPERVFQTPDCLVVAAQRGERWEVSALGPRRVGGNVEAVRLRTAAGAGGRPVIEAVDLEGTRRTITRWRYTGTAIEQAF